MQQSPGGALGGRLSRPGHRRATGLSELQRHHSCTVFPAWHARHCGVIASQQPPGPSSRPGHRRRPRCLHSRRTTPAPSFPFGTRDSVGSLTRSRCLGVLGGRFSRLWPRPGHRRATSLPAFPSHHSCTVFPIWHARQRGSLTRSRCLGGAWRSILATLAPARAQAGDLAA